MLTMENDSEDFYHFMNHTWYIIDLYDLELSGLINIKCHEKFKTCMKKVQKSGKVGFSRECPFERAVATMEQGMNLAILFSQFGSSKLELWLAKVKASRWLEYCSHCHHIFSFSNNYYSLNLNSDVLNGLTDSCWKKLPRIH